MTGRKAHLRDRLHRQPPPSTSTTSSKDRRTQKEPNSPSPSNISTEKGLATSPPPAPPPPPTTTTESRRSTSIRRDHQSLLKPDLGSASTTTTGTETPSNADINQKVVDAHSLVLAITNHWRLPRSEWLLWVMNHMFRPLSPKESKDSYFEVIELTELNLPFWVDTTSPPVKVDFGFPARDTTSTPGTRPGPAYRIVPHTQVYTLYHCYSMVFLLDVSSSLTTIDPYRQAILVDEVLINFRQCLAGITQPFVIPSQYRQERYHFQPQIHLSVLADCTQNLPTSTHRQSPSTRILVHNILLTADNLEETFQLILTQFQTLQAEMADHYHGSLTHYLSPTQPNLDTEVNSSHLLEAGILSLRLLPQEGSPVVILITDGVADVGRVDFDEGLRTMARDGVLLTVIQVGSNLGFTPGCSFGYVPDNEALRFLAMATGGKFIYATDCPELHHPPRSHDTQPQDHPPQYPNFYHRLLLIQEARFQRQRHDNRHASVNIGRERVGDLPSQRLLNSQPPGTHSDYKESNFPWSFQAPPPPTEYLLTRYRDYALPLETSCILNARLREGFFIERIALSGSKQSRAEKIHINLTMTWLPNVMIQYRIRAQLPSDMKSYHANSRSKYIRIEMNILASTVFAVSFVNVDATQGSSGTSPLLTNVLSLHQFLKSIFATDDTLKSLNAMLQQFPMLKAPRDRSSSSLLIDSHLLQQLDVESVRALWSSFENSRLDYISNGLFDRFSTTLALIPEWQGQHPSESATPPLTFRPTDLSPLVTGELGYSCISDTTYIKYLHAQKLGQHNFLSFCILRIIPITHYLMLTRLAFVNVRYSVREMLSRQHAALHAKLSHSNGSTFLVRNCHRPLQSLLVDNRYYPHNRSPTRAVEASNWSANYLVTASKSWLMSSYRETYFPDQGYPTIDQLVFNLLMKAKRAQGFIQIGNHDPHRILFYKEISSPWQDRTREFGIQYQLAMTSEHITSHIWAEPITSDTFTDGCQATIQQVLRRDEVVVSNLLAFDSIHHACRARKNIISQPLRLRSLVLNSVALISHYRCPHVVCDLPLTDQDISPLLRPPYFIPSQKESPPYLLELDWEEEAFLKFHPVVIHHILFQFFIETNLLSHCDALIIGQMDDPCDTFVERLPTDPLPPGSYRISPTTASLKWGTAKLMTPTTFALMFIPNAWDMIHSFRQHGSAQHGYLTTWSFECIRENLQNPFQESFNLSVQELTRLQSGPSYSNRYPFIPHYESLHSIIETCDRTEFWTEWSKSQPNVSSSIHHLQSTLDGIYGKAFVQSLYSSLLLGYPIHTHDLHDALNLCWKFHFSINLTDYLNLKTEKCRRHLDQDFQPSYESQFQAKFAMILGYHFGIIPGWRGSYFFKNLYQTSFQVTGDLEPPGESHNEPVTLPRLLEQAANPILMRLHFVYTNPHQSPSTYSVVTNTVPTSYTIPLSELDYSPSQIGTESSPLESADGTSVSIEFTLYIPKPSSPLPPDQASQIQSLLESEDLLKHPQVGLVLPRHHLRALTETKSRIEWLIKEEVIHGLLTWSPITSHVLHWIDRKLSVRNPFVDFPSSFSMQLKLVDKVAGAALFSRELEHISIHPYCIVRCEGYFYVQPVKSSHSQHPYLSPFLAPRDGDSPLVDGLGISVLDSPDDESNGLNFWMLLVPTPDQVQISFFSKSVAGLERSRIIQRIRRKIGELLRRVNQTLLLDELDTTRQCSKYLLPPDSGDEGTESLNSESDEEPPSSSDQEGGSAQSLSLSDFTAEFQLQVGPSRFKPGQFQCPLQFKELFTLHWRVKPMMALSHILTSVMHPLYVSNRQNLFVIRDSQAAFYMRLSEFKDGSLDDHSKLPGMEGNHPVMDTPTSSHHHPASPMLHASIMSSYSAIGIATLDSLKDHSPRPGQSSPSIKRMSSSHTIASHHPLFHPAALNASPHLNQRGIALEVYGIQPPGREITQDLVSLIDGRLTNHLTLNIISSYLARNATLKLTPADVQFIFPLKSHPTPMTRVSLPVPPFVLNPLLTLLYCKQNLLGYLHLLSGLDGRHQYRQFLHSYYRHWPHPESCDCFVGDFVFFYNCIASRNPTPVEQALGQGLGLVCLTLTDLNNEPLYQPATQNLQHVGYKPYRSSTISEIQAMLEGTPGTPEKFQIHADIWTIGSVNAEALRQKVLLSLRQSFSDYMMDCCIKSLQHELPLLSDKRPNRTMSESDKGETRVPDKVTPANLTTRLVSQLGEPSTRILQCGVDLGNPAMLITTVPCELDMASQKLIVAHLHHWLTEYHLHLTPTIWELQGEGMTPVGTPQLESVPLSPPHSMPPCDFLLISGLDLPARGGGPTQWGSRPSEVTPTRRSSLEDRGSVQSLGRTTLKRDSAVDDIQLYPSLHLPHSCSTGPPPLELIRSHLILILTNGHQIQICSYNLPPVFTEALSLHIERCIAWQQSRAQLGEFGLLSNLNSFHLQDTNHPHPTPVVTAPSLEPPSSGRSTASESKLDSKPSPIEVQYTRHQETIHTAPSSRHLRSPRTPLSSTSRSKPVLDSGDSDRVSITFNDDSLPESQRGGRTITRGDSQGTGSQLDPLPATPTLVTSEANPGEPMEPRDNSPLNSQEYLDHYSRQLFNSSRALDKLHSSNLTEQLQAIYRHWGSPPSELTPVDLEEVTILIQTAHPIHHCPVPLFHFRVPEESLHPQYVFKESDQSHPDFIRWYPLVIQEFQTTYGEYLTGLGLQRLGSVVEPGEVTSCPPTLYQRWADGHLVLVTVAVRAMVVHINVYAVPSLQKPPVIWSDEAMTACLRIKRAICGPLFGYDFHIHHLQAWLDGRLDATPSTNVLTLLGALQRSSPLQTDLPTHHTLTSGTLTPQCSAAEIYQYILKSPHRYGMRNIYHDNRPIGFCIADTQTPHRQVIAITLAGDRFHYYALVVSHLRPLDYDRPLGGTSDPPIPDPSTVIHDQLQSVLSLHTRDTIWRSLQDTPTDLTDKELDQLESNFSHLDLFDIEPTLHQLPPDLPWPSILHHLQTFLPRMARGGTLQSRPTLLLFNPYDSQYLLYLRHHPLQLRAVARDPRTTPRVVECEHVTYLVRTILYGLWQTLHSPPPPNSF